MQFSSSISFTPSFSPYQKWLWLLFSESSPNSPATPKHSFTLLKIYRSFTSRQIHIFDLQTNALPTVAGKQFFFKFILFFCTCFFNIFLSLLIKWKMYFCCNLLSTFNGLLSYTSSTRLWAIRLLTHYQLHFHKILSLYSLTFCRHSRHSWRKAKNIQL